MCLVEQAVCNGLLAALARRLIALISGLVERLLSSDSSWVAQS